MFIKLLLIFSGFCLLSVCSDLPLGGAGYLIPQKGDGVTLITEEKTNDTAQLESNSVQISVSGDWANQERQILDIQIDNKSGSAIRFDYGKVKFMGESGENLVLSFVNDTTNVSLSGHNSNGNEVKRIYPEGSKQKTDLTIDVPSGEQRKISLFFNNFTNRENALTKGKIVTVTIPVFQTGQDHEIIFKCD